MTEDPEPGAEPRQAESPSTESPSTESPSTESPSTGSSGTGPSGAGEDAPVRDDDIVDELPADLDLSDFVGPHTFPNNNRRRIPAAIYLAIGLGCIVLFVVRDGESALVNSGILVAGIGLVLFGIYGMVAGWTLRVDESDALVTASTQVGFAVGHASAQQVWHGWLSRPTWRILAYSAENPPRRRGIVLIDGVSGDVLEWYSEENPEDWAALDPNRTALSGD